MIEKYRSLYDEKKGSVRECLDRIVSGDVVSFAGMGNTAVSLQKEFHTIAYRVENVEAIVENTSEGHPFICDPGMRDHIHCIGFFWGRDMVAGSRVGNSSYLAADVCGIGKTVISRKPTVFISAASPMDEDGNFQIGLCNMWEPDVVEYIISTGGKIILEVNHAIQKVSGGVDVNIRDVTCFVEENIPLRTAAGIEPSPEERMVAQNVRSLMRDGDCVQFGIGSLPDAIAAQCMDLKDLGLHTEMITSAVGKMIREGVLNGERKNIHKNQHLFTFCGGDQELYQTLFSNPDCQIVPGSYANNPFIIAQNDNMVSVNTCIEMDLSGQVASESIGYRQHSGTGGAFNFAYGAYLSKGGRGIIAFTSTSKKGKSKIRSTLMDGAAVSISRNYVDYIVTEYGIAPMRGRSVRQRAENLISIAHPDFRKELTESARKMNYL